MMSPLGRKRRKLRVISGFLRALNQTPRAAPATWPSTVAQAAPTTPMPRPKMKMGSKIMLITAPTI